MKAHSWASAMPTLIPPAPSLPPMGPHSVYPCGMAPILGYIYFDDVKVDEAAKFEPEVMKRAGSYERACPNPSGTAFLIACFNELHNGLWDNAGRFNSSDQGKG